MMDGLISKFRIWHFGYVCRRDPERIGRELRRMLVEFQGSTRWAHARELLLSERVGTSPPALGAVAASRWKITDSAEMERVFESLTEEQQARICSAVNFILPRRRG